MDITSDFINHKNLPSSVVTEEREMTQLTGYMLQPI